VSCVCRGGRGRNGVCEVLRFLDEGGEEPVRSMGEAVGAPLRCCMVVKVRMLVGWELAELGEDALTLSWVDALGWLGARDTGSAASLNVTRFELHGEDTRLLACGEERVGTLVEKGG
jgi:hypothetical protein